MSYQTKSYAVLSCEHVIECAKRRILKVEAARMKMKAENDAKEAELKRKAEARPRWLKALDPKPSIAVDRWGEQFRYGTVIHVCSELTALAKAALQTGQDTMTVSADDWGYIE